MKKLAFILAFFTMNVNAWTFKIKNNTPWNMTVNLTTTLPGNVVLPGFVRLVRN